MASAAGARSASKPNLIFLERVRLLEAYLHPHPQRDLLRNSRCGLSRFARANQSARAGEAHDSSANNYALRCRLRYKFVSGS